MIEQASRRHFLRVLGGIAAGAALQPTAGGAVAAEAGSATLSMQEAIGLVAGNARVHPGRLTLELPPLVENGNAVALSVRADSPMTAAEHVRAIHVFAEKNPQPYVAAFHLGPRSGRASVATRIRLADSQTVVAICQMSDGSWWSDSVSVVVTLAACTEVL